MQIIDLSHPLENGMPVYPGSEHPEFSKIASLDREGYNEIMLSLPTHTGTHVDCGYHILADGQRIHETPLDSFVGNAVVIDCRVAGGGKITPGLLEPYASLFVRCRFVLLRTGWDRFWGSDEYFNGYPLLDEEAARYLCSFAIRGIGVDAVSFDPVHDTDLVIHHILLSHGIILIENLTCLEYLPASGFLFTCLPLPLKDGDGSPVRAAGIVEER
jgi:kynurenine formamidase